MRRQLSTLGMGAVKLLLLALIGCSNKTKNDEDCAAQTAPDKAVSEKAVTEKATTEGETPVKAAASPDADWCRACVVGPHGFMSCQRVAATEGESRGELRALARDKACEDSGFKKEGCPDQNVIAISCKGDPPPKDKTAAGKAMLKALKNSGPLILKKPDEKAGGDAPAAPASGGDAPQKETAPSKKSSDGAKTKTPVPVV